MAQLFAPSANSIARASILGFLLLLGFITWIAYRYHRSSYFTQIGLALEQPVPFSHKHHVDALGIDCRYCHATAEVSAFAGIPPTATCMNCHSVVWADAPMLAPVRQSWTTGHPLAWNRVHRLPDHVYFNHSIHVAKGIGCSTCHGRVDQMPLMWKSASLFMQWCLDCHRNPEPSLRPPDAIYSMDWVPPPDQAQRSRELAEFYHIRREGLTNCNVCHR